MGLSTKSFGQLVTDMGTAIQGAAAALVDMSVGSVLLAVIQANAAVMLWLQSLLLQLLSVTRAATSLGSDLDSWMADYGFSRLPGAAAIAQVTFSRFTPTQATIVPVGVTVQSADASLQYTVVADPTNASYSATLNGYPLTAGQASVNATVQAVAIGSAYNAQVGQVNTLGSPMPGIDLVTNQNAITSGADPESDVAVRARFVQWIASLSKATKGAVGFAISQVLNSATYSIVEDVTYSGSPQPGYFYAVVDDGSGNPPQSFLSAVYSAIDAVRPLGVTFGVYGPVLLQANFTAFIAVGQGYNVQAVKAAVASAITAYINSLPLGAALPYSRLIQIAYDASPGVVNVTGATLNGATSDIAGTPTQVIRAGTIACN